MPTRVSVTVGTDDFSVTKTLDVSSEMELTLDGAVEVARRFQMVLTDFAENRRLGIPDSHEWDKLASESPRESQALPLPREPEVPDAERMAAQCREISVLLSEAGVGAMPIVEGVRTLMERLDTRRLEDIYQLLKERLR